MIKFQNWCNITSIFITFAIISISSGPPFLKSCVTLLHSNVFAGPESNISNNYANQNLYLQNILLGRRSKERPYLNQLGKNLQLLFVTPSLAAIVCWRVLGGDHRSFLPQMVHDMGFIVNHQRNMTLKGLAAKITPQNAHLITLSEEKSRTMLFKALKRVL